MKNILDTDTASFSLYDIRELKISNIHHLSVYLLSEIVGAGY